MSVDRNVRRLQQLLTDRDEEIKQLRNDSRLREALALHNAVKQERDHLVAIIQEAVRELEAEEMTGMAEPLKLALTEVGAS